MYKEIMQDNPYGEPVKFVVRDNGNNCFTSFPADPQNTDYQAYLAWLAEGNTPEEA